MKLEVRNVFFSYIDGQMERIILENINADFEEGKLYAIMGGSGSGKTTFLSLIGALLKQKKGEIIFDGKSIEEIGYDMFRRKYSSFVFQNYNLIYYMNAIENIEIAMNISDPKMRVSKENIIKLLNRFGISESNAKKKVSKLSGGEQQRVAIIRAISTNPKIILADEPTGNLDYSTTNSIINLFKVLAREYQKCVIVVTHDIGVAYQCDIVYKIDNINKELVKVNSND